MIKAVYRKIFLNKIWLQCIFVCFINLFLYKYVCARNVSEETEELFAFILLGMWGLVFYLVMYGGSLLLVIGIILFMRKRIYKKADETIEWKCRWQVAGFTVLAVLFILFMGLMYSTDVGTWERLTEGYQLLRGVM